MNNRPIKFRVWSTEYKQWMNHCSVIDSEGNILILYYELKQDRMLHPIVSEYSPDSVTIQQFTGLTDSTGKEIYEGDICLYRKQYREVRIGEFWDGVDDRVGVFLQDPKVIHRNFGTNKLDSISSCEVFGNIFETPELLA